jgi:FG-GAP-like repeat
MSLPRRVAWFAGIVFASLAANLAACAVLESIPPGQCGNRVKESGEDCDSEVDTGRFDGGQGFCGANANGPGACHYLCGLHIPDGGPDASSECPSDEVCSLSDAICRPDPLLDAGPGAEYQFGRLGPPILERAHELATGDFDGDGIGDVLAVSSTRTDIYRGSSKGLTSAFETELVFNGARAARLTGTPPPAAPRRGFEPVTMGQDPTDDLVFVVDQGIAVMTGQAGGALTPAAYAKVDVPQQFRFAGFVFGRDASMTPLQAQSTPWLFIQFDPKTPVLDSMVNCDPLDSGKQLAFQYISSAPHPVRCFPGKVTTDLSNAVSAPLSSDPLAACEQFVWGFTGETFVTVFQPCVPGDDAFTTWDSTTAIHVDIGGSGLAWGPLVYDVDGDGKLDIIAGRSDKKIVVAYNLGGLQFSSMPMGPMDNLASVYSPVLLNWALDQSPDQLTDPLLAIGDVNGDHNPDFVTKRGLYVSSAASTWAAPELYQVFAGAIQSAAFGDFNGDGLTDVAVASMASGGGVPELDLFLTSRKRFLDLPLLDRYIVPVDDYVFDVVSGDFNGDGIADIAFGQTTDAQLHAPTLANVYDFTDRITMVYGDPDANFQPVALGDVPGITGMLSIDIFNPRETFDDGFADLGVIFTRGPSDFAASILSGRPGHLMVAPLGLTSVITVDSKMTLVSALALAATGGVFGSPRQDLGSVAIETSPGGALTTKLDAWRTVLDGNAVAGKSSFATIGDTKLFGGGVPSFDPSTLGAATTAFPVDGGQYDWLVAAVAGGDYSRLYFCKPDGDAFTGESIQLMLSGPASTGTPHVHVEAGKFGDPSATKVVVLVGNDLFVATYPVANGAALEPLKLDDLGTVMEFALLQPSSDKSLLVLATDYGVFLTDLAKGAVPYRAPGTEQLTLSPIAVAAADVDGDRLPDLIVATADGISTFQMLPKPYFPNGP